MITEKLVLTFLPMVYLRYKDFVNIERYSDDPLEYEPSYLRSSYTNMCIVMSY